MFFLISNDPSSSSFKNWNLGNLRRFGGAESLQQCCSIPWKTREKGNLSDPMSSCKTKEMAWKIYLFSTCNPYKSLRFAYPHTLSQQSPRHGSLSRPAEWKFGERSQAPWKQKVPYFVRIQTATSANSLHSCRNLSRDTVLNKSLEYKLSPAMRLQACQWHCILPSCH